MGRFCRHPAAQGRTAPNGLSVTRRSDKVEQLKRYLYSFGAFGGVRRGTQLCGAEGPVLGPLLQPQPQLPGGGPWRAFCGSGRPARAASVSPADRRAMGAGARCSC